KHKMDTEAKNGAKGSTGITPVVAIAIANDDAHATLGTGGLLTIGGEFKADSSLTNAVHTKAEGDTQSSSTGVGITVGVTGVNDTSLATTGRDVLTTAGGAAFLSKAISGSETIAKASAKGGQQDGDNGGESVD